MKILVDKVTLEKILHLLDAQYYNSAKLELKGLLGTLPENQTGITTEEYCSQKDDIASLDEIVRGILSMIIDNEITVMCNQKATREEARKLRARLDGKI
jgi:hypothetical protein